MEFRRSGQGDQRRRRVLRDDKQSSPDEAPDATPARTRRGAAGAASRGYSEAAHRERQPRVVDFLPTRLWTVSVLLLGALTCVVMLAACHLYLPELSQLSGRRNLSAFDLGAPNSVGAWFSSLLFTAAAGWSLLIYSLRRHKVDDYRGRYRIWLPAAAALLLLSVDATTGLHRLAVGTIVRLSGFTAFGDGPVWSVMLYGFLLGTLGLRLAIEMRRSRLSVSAFSIAAACYGLSVPLSLGTWLSADPLLATLARSLLFLLGHLGIATSVGLYARHVYLDSQGRLNPRKAKPKKAKKAKSESLDDEANEKKPTTTSAGGKTRRIDGAHADPPAPKTAQSGTPTSGPAKSAGPLASKMAPAGGTSSKFGDATQAKASASVSRQSDDDDDDDDDDDGEDGDSRLSRAERKRLKKLQRRGAVR